MVRKATSRSSTTPWTEPDSNGARSWAAGLTRRERFIWEEVAGAAVSAIFAGSFRVKKYGFCDNNVHQLVAGGCNEGFADPVAAVLDQGQAE
jgi:hypothetical protein